MMPARRCLRCCISLHKPPLPCLCLCAHKRLFPCRCPCTSWSWSVKHPPAYACVQEGLSGSVTAAMGPDDAKQAVAVVQCLQRLCASPAVAEALINTPGAMGRLFTCLAGGARGFVWRV